MSENPWVTLISSDGHRFVLPRTAALGSILLSDSLTSGFSEGENSIITLHEQRAEVLEKVAEYLMYKEKYTGSKDEIPDFKDRVRPEIALELLMATGKTGILNEGLLGEVRGISEGNPLAFFLPSGFHYLLRVVSALPDGPRSWALVQFYFARHEWYTKSLHAPSFLEEAQLLLSLSPYEAARQVRPEWLCCYLVVLCLALHLIDPEVQLQLGYSTQETVDLAKQMFSAAQAVLWASDFLSSHTLDHLQCIVLMGVYQFDVDDQSDAGWALLGSARR